MIFLYGYRLAGACDARQIEASFKNSWSYNGYVCMDVWSQSAGPPFYYQGLT